MQMPLVREKMHMQRNQPFKRSTLGGGRRKNTSHDLIKLLQSRLSVPKNIENDLKETGFIRDLG